MVEIVNVVGSGDLGVELDLENLASDLDTPFVDYDPSNYHGLYVRLEDSGPLITVYRSGKYIISGCPSVDVLEETNTGFLGHLSQLHIIDESQQTGFTLQNVVCTATLEVDVSLSTLAIALGLETVEYEPEQFPGLIYRPTEVEAVLLVFANGKVVITGGANRKVAESAFSHLRTRMQEFL